MKDIPLPKDISPTTLFAMYTTMVRIRQFEERTAELLLEGKIRCPVQLYIGQEAVAGGVCANLRKDDYAFSTHRSHGHYIAKGGDLKALSAEMFGKATGCSKGRGGSMHLASPDVGLPGSAAIVAGTIPLAVGASLAFSIQGKDSVSVAFFGDGATNEGVFYESLNFASLKKLPIVFVCENNLYSTHMPIAACLASTEIYRNGEAFCMPGIRVDGNDVVAVFEAAKKAIQDARLGRGPALIECMTYRWRGHVGPSDDLDKGLRSREELDHWMSRCPIRGLEKLLLEQGILSESEKTSIYEMVNREVEESIIFAEQSPYPDACEVLDNVFKA